MLNKEEQVEIFESEEIITFSDDAGNEYSYAQVACVEHEGEFFVLLEPADEKQAEEEGLYIFKILNYDKPDEDWEIEPVMSEELANIVYDKFIEVYEQECSGNCASCMADCADRK